MYSVACPRGVNRLRQSWFRSILRFWLCVVEYCLHQYLCTILAITQCTDCRYCAAGCCIYARQRQNGCSTWRIFLRIAIVRWRMHFTTAAHTHRLTSTGNSHYRTALADKYHLVLIIYDHFSLPWSKNVFAWADRSRVCQPRLTLVLFLVFPHVRRRLDVDLKTIAWLNFRKLVKSQQTSFWLVGIDYKTTCLRPIYG